MPRSRLPLIVVGAHKPPRGPATPRSFRPLVALLDGREAERDATDVPAASFRIWLQRLPDTDLPDAALDRFLSDVLATLESFELNGSSSGGGGLICI